MKRASLLALTVTSVAAAGLIAPALYAHGGVTLCQHPNFGGRCQTFDRDVPDLRSSRIGDDEATSVRVDPGCQARLYQHLNFRGDYTELHRDASDLRGSRVGDDSITSLEVRCDDRHSHNGYGHGHGHYGDGHGHYGDGHGHGGSHYGHGHGHYGHGHGYGHDGHHGSTHSGYGYDDKEGVTFYRDGNYTGIAETFVGDVPDLRRTRVGDDHITSVGLHRHCRARLYQHPNYRGDYTELRESIPLLRGSRVGDDGASSLKVRCGWDLDWDRDYRYR